MEYKIICPSCNGINKIDNDFLLQSNENYINCYICDLYIKTIGNINDIVGMIPIDIGISENEIIFTFNDYSHCKFFHEQNCCENVFIDDINGNFQDLIGVPILVAEERSSLEKPEGFRYNKDVCLRSNEEWTFYAFRSVKGSVDVRWYRESSGDYSTKVAIEFAPASSPHHRERAGNVILHFRNELKMMTERALAAEKKLCHIKSCKPALYAECLNSQDI